MTKDETLQMCLEYIETNAHERRHVRWAIKVALAQPEERPWVGLTDEDKDEIIRVTMHNDFCDILMLAEAALKEKNT